MKSDQGTSDDQYLRVPAGAEQAGSAFLGQQPAPVEALAPSHWWSTTRRAGYLPSCGPMQVVDRSGWRGRSGEGTVSSTPKVAPSGQHPHQCVLSGCLGGKHLASFDFLSLSIPAKSGKVCYTRGTCMPGQAGGGPEAKEATHMKPEEQARARIDALLSQAGWLVQDYAQLNLGAGRGIAIRESPLPQ